MAKSGNKKVTLEIRRGIQTRYIVLHATNCLSPEPGSAITQAEAQRLIDEGVEVVVRRATQQ
jgi:hypothetical protein